MKNNLVGLLVGLAISLVVVGSVMMPALNDATATHETFDNSDFSYYDMKEIEVGDTWTYSDSVWYFDGEQVTALNSGSVSVIVTEDCSIRSNGQIRGTTISGNSVTSAISALNSDDETYLQINGSSTAPVYEVGYGVTSDGDYVLKTYDDAAYVNGDTQLWVTGITGLGSYAANSVIIHIEGTIDDGLTVSALEYINGNVSDISVGDYTINYEEVDGYEDLYLIESVEFDVTGTIEGDDSATTVTATYSTFVLPKEVTAELSVHMTDTEITLMDVIPVMVILAIFMFAAYAVTKRD